MASMRARRNQREYDIFLLGKTGSGKSATGNSILSNDPTIKYFDSSSSLRSVTFRIDRRWNLLDKCLIKVIDGPGLAETRMDPKQAAMKAEKDMGKAVALSGDGFHALLLVLSLSERYTDETKMCINMLKNFFGDDFLSRYGILVLTGGDRFKENMEDEGTPGMGIEEWCQRQQEEFGKLIQECNFRVVLFNNRAKTTEERREQRTKLFTMIDSLGGVKYTNELFDKAQKARNKHIAEENKPELNEDLMRDVSILLNFLDKLTSNIDEGTSKEKEDELREAEIQADQLLATILNRDNGKGSLSKQKILVENVKRTIKTNLELCSRLQQAKREAEEEKLRQAQREAEEAKKREKAKRDLEEAEKLSQAKREAELMGKLQQAKLEVEEEKSRERERAIEKAEKLQRKAKETERKLKEENVLLKQYHATLAKQLDATKVEEERSWLGKAGDLISDGVRGTARYLWSWFPPW